MHRVTVGSVEITAILDTPLLMDPKQFMPRYADQFSAEYSHLADERGLMQMSISCYLVRSAGKNILVDTGLGARRRPGFPRGKLDEGLKDAGVAPSEIDTVLHTHLHIDHVGWNTIDADDGSRQVFFPKARFVIQQAEWDYWMTAEQLEQPGNAHLVECVAPLKETGYIDFTSGEKAFDQNLTFISAPGHTPGHVAVGIASQGERAVIVGDASHHPAQLDHPDWSPAFDTDPVLSAKTREGLFNAAADDGRTWIAGHWPHPGFGRIVRLEGKRSFRAL
jgi:glyoxylase-like metal-dependent hydrolase (beta-lactamase superfamily II)